MRPKVFEFSLTNGQSTTVYWPIDTHSTPDFGISFQQTAGAGSITGASAAFTMYPVLSRGVASATASFVPVTSAAAAVAAFTVQHSGALSCWRFAATCSGNGTFAWIGVQAGPDRVA